MFCQAVFYLERMIEEGVPPALDGDGAFEGVEGLHEAFEDEGSDVDGFFAAFF